MEKILLVMAIVQCCCLTGLLIILTLKHLSNLGKLQYSFMWSQYISDRDPALQNDQEQFRKWAQTFLIDWKATKHLSLSLFENSNVARPGFVKKI
jgi:hypothetical protein